MDSVIDQIKKKIDIVDFIGSFIPLKKAGRNFKANCPFHQEKTPSFVISPERQIWHCFGSCGEGGDIIRFLMKWENITFIEALRDLANKAGIKLQNVRLKDNNWDKKERLMMINSLACEYYEYILNKTTIGEKARDYLKSRNINPKISSLFQIGYSPRSWDSLLNYLKKKKYSNEEIYEVGLTVKNDSNHYYDRFRGRLTFPLKDPRGNVLGFSGRILEGEDMAKYINTPESPIYHKRETASGINLTKDAIKKHKKAILVEGEFDVIGPYQYGIENIVAIKGSAVTREQLMLIKRYTNSITLCLDNDNAGIEAIKRGIEETEKLNFEVDVVTFDYAKDPDEAVRKDHVKFKKAIDSPIPIYDFILSVVQSKHLGNDPYSKKQIGDEVLPYIETIKNPIVQSYYIRKMANILDVSEGSIEAILRQIRKNKTKPHLNFIGVEHIEEKDRSKLIQQYILSVLFQNKDPFNFSEEISKVILPIYFTIPAYQKIFEPFLEFKKNQKTKFNIDDFIRVIPNELKPSFDEIYLFASSEIFFENEKIEKLLYDIKRFFLKKRIFELLKEKDDIDDNSRSSLLSKLNEELKQVEKNIISL